MASRLKKWREKQKRIRQYIADSDEESETHDVLKIIESPASEHEDFQHGYCEPNQHSDMEIDSEDDFTPHFDYDINDYVMSSDEEGECLERSDEEDVVEDSLNQSLAKCALENGWTHNSIDELLKVLRIHGHEELPKTARTLLKCPRDIGVSNKCGGEYVYLGLKENIVRILNDDPITSNDTLEILVNIDGLPLYKSSPKSVWGILCVLNNSEVFVVCLYYGQVIKI